MKLATATLPTTSSAEQSDDVATYDDAFFGGDETEVEATAPATEAAPEQPATSTEAEPIAEVDEEERRWWAKVEVLGKIKDCARMIEEVETEVDGYQEAIKESKEVLKGQQALLARYSSQLADIIEGKPLPKNPNQPAATDGSGDIGQVSTGIESIGDWRDVSTESLLAGLKGLGAKKLEAIIEAAPTAGKLEELRGQASLQHKPFKDVLPKGCGEVLADEIENRLMDLVAKSAAIGPDEEEYEDAE